MEQLVMAVAVVAASAFAPGPITANEPIPDPSTLNGGEAGHVASEHSEGVEVYPITVNLQEGLAKAQEKLELLLRALFAEHGIENLWIHFNINRGKGSSVSFWVSGSHTTENLGDILDARKRNEIIAEHAELHLAHRVMVRRRSSALNTGGRIRKGYVRLGRNYDSELAKKLARDLNRSAGDCSFEFIPEGGKFERVTVEVDGRMGNFKSTASAEIWAIGVCQ